MPFANQRAMILSAPGRFSPKAGSAADSRGIEAFRTNTPPPRVGSPPSIVADGGGTGRSGGYWRRCRGFPLGVLEEDAQIAVGHGQTRDLVGVLLHCGVDLQRLRQGVAVGREQGISQAFGQLVHLDLDGRQGLDQGEVFLELAHVQHRGQDVGVGRGNRIRLFDEGGVAVRGLEQRPDLGGVQRDQEIQLGTDVGQFLEDVVLGVVGQGGRDQVLRGHGNCLLGRFVRDNRHRNGDGGEAE